MNINEIVLDYTVLRQGVLVLRAVNHKFRQEIIELIDSEGATTLKELHQFLGGDISVLVQHLGILRRSKIVGISGEIKQRTYHLNEERLEKIRILVDALAEKTDDSKHSGSMSLSVIGQ